MSNTDTDISYEYEYQKAVKKRFNLTFEDFQTERKFKFYAREFYVRNDTQFIVDTLNDLAKDDTSNFPAIKIDDNFKGSINGTKFYSLVRKCYKLVLTDEDFDDECIYYYLEEYSKNQIIGAIVEASDWENDAKRIFSSSGCSKATLRLQTSIFEKCIPIKTKKRTISNNWLDYVYIEDLIVDSTSLDIDLSCLKGMELSFLILAYSCYALSLMRSAHLPYKTLHIQCESYADVIAVKKLINSCFINISPSPVMALNYVTEISLKDKDVKFDDKTNRNRCVILDAFDSNDEAKALWKLIPEYYLLESEIIKYSMYPYYCLPIVISKIEDDEDFINIKVDSKQLSNLQTKCKLINACFMSQLDLLLNPQSTFKDSGQNREYCEVTCNRVIETIIEKCLFSNPWFFYTSESENKYSEYKKLVYDTFTSSESQILSKLYDNELTNFQLLNLRLSKSTLKFLAQLLSYIKNPQSNDKFVKNRPYSIAEAEGKCFIYRTEDDVEVLCISDGILDALSDKSEVLKDLKRHGWLYKTKGENINVTFKQKKDTGKPERKKYKSILFSNLEKSESELLTYMPASN